MAIVGAGVLRPATAWARRKAATTDATNTAVPSLELTPGTRIGRWNIVEVRQLTDGGIPVVMAGDDGVQFQVELTRRDPDETEKPVAVTEKVALYLSNGGGGNTATVEEHGLGVMALGAYLREHEDKGMLKLPPLMTLRERIEIYRQLEARKEGGAVRPG